MIYGYMSFDGGVRGGNPGHAGFAAVIRTGEREYVIARPMRGKKTNNDAEYTGLIVGLKYALHLGVQEIEIVSDSKLVVEQVNGKWKCDSKTMRDYQHEAKSFLDERFLAWKLSWVPRLENTVADAACAQAVLCSLNPWKPNHLDPFAPNSFLARPSRTRLRAMQ